LTSVEIDPDWLAKLYAASDHFFADHLGPQIASTAKRLCPEQTGSLADSIEDHLNGHTLVVSATGGAGGRIYAAYVELGHRIAHGPHMSIVGPKVKGPEPFLRPALYQSVGGG